MAGSCWCGAALAGAVGPHYRRCAGCGTAVRDPKPPPAHFDVADDAHDFYGRRYWNEYCRERHLPDIGARMRADLSDRCLFWLERLLEVTSPPGRLLEIGCGHGGFVRLAREMGWEATGTELSPWVVDFVRRAFDVPVHRGRLETLALEPGFRCIAAFDVLEHLNDPEETVRRAADLLAPDGVLVLQTPWFRGEGPDWAMFQEEEHVHLFTAEAVRLLLDRVGLGEALIRPSLFPYDMWVVASRRRFPLRAAVDAFAELPAAGRALLDLARSARETREELLERGREVMELTRLLRESETDRAARLEQIVQLNGLLAESEADRAARLEQIVQLKGLLAESEADRAARFAQVGKLGALLAEAESDRAARFDQIQELTRLVKGLEGRLAELEGRLAEIEQTKVWRAYSALRSLRAREKAG